MADQEQTIRHATFEEILARDGELIYKTRGVSMYPMLRQDRDLVIVQVPASRLRQFDVALYKRGKAYVLHRIVDVKDGYYLIRGDNTYTLEKVPDQDVIGVLTGFVRKGKTWSVDDRKYRAYVRVWCGMYPLRRFLIRFRVLRRILGKVLRWFG